MVDRVRRYFEDGRCRLLTCPSFPLIHQSTLNSAGRGLSLVCQSIHKADSILGESRCHHQPAARPSVLLACWLACLPPALPSRWQLASTVVGILPSLAFTRPTWRIVMGRPAGDHDWEPRVAGAVRIAKGPGVSQRCLALHDRLSTATRRIFRSLVDRRTRRIGLLGRGEPRNDAV